MLSDDCSTDGTFEIMRDTVARYTGPHSVILNRNACNLGLSGHVNRIHELASGEVIIASDGDDISSPARAKCCVDAWLKHGKPAALYSSVSCIDADGRALPRNGAEWFAQCLPLESETPGARLLRYSREGRPRLVSCSAAWTKEMFDVFGPLSPNLWFEDDVITLRAWLFDRVVFIPEPLVKYREHDSNLVNRVRVPLTTLKARQEAEQAKRTEARRRRESLQSYIPDLEFAVRRGWITQSLCEQVKQQVEAQCVMYQIIEDWWNVDWFMRPALLLFLVKSGRMREGRWCSPRLLPFRTFLSLGAVWSRARSFGQQMVWQKSPVIALTTCVGRVAVELL